MSEEEERAGDNDWLHVLATEERAQEERTERAIRAVDAQDAKALATAIGCSVEEAERTLAKLKAPSREERDAWLYRWAILARLPEIP